MPGYPYERQIEYWTSRAVEDFFLDAGYEVLVFPGTQIIENKVPFDHLFLETHTNKLFGFQYKRLYSNGQEYWKLDLSQHNTLQSYRAWIYYCGTEIRSPRQHRNALHLCQILPVDFPFRSRLPVDRRQDPSKIWYFRWGGFVQALGQCRVGQRIERLMDVVERMETLGQLLMELAVDIFFVDLTAQRLTHFTPLLRDIGDIEEYDEPDTYRYT